MWPYWPCGPSGEVVKSKLWFCLYLQWIAHSVSDDGSLVAFSLLAEIPVVVGVGFDELLGIVPGAAGVAHADSQLHSREQGASEEAIHGIDTYTQRRRFNIDTHVRNT